jgi:hypothetical protein
LIGWFSSPDGITTVKLRKNEMKTEKLGPALVIGLCTLMLCCAATGCVHAIAASHDEPAMSINAESMAFPPGGVLSCPSCTSCVDLFFYIHNLQIDIADAEEAVEDADLDWRLAKGEYFRRQLDENDALDAYNADPTPGNWALYILAQQATQAAKDAMDAAKVILDTAQLYPDQLLSAEQDALDDADQYCSESNPPLNADLVPTPDPISTN